MKEFQKILSHIHNGINGHECDFGPKDEAFLKQFGIKRITGVRDSANPYPKEMMTELDRAQEAAGHIGCNESSLQDFVCEKDGLQFKVFIHYGIWLIGHDVLWQNNLITVS